MIMVPKCKFFLSGEGTIPDSVELTCKIADQFASEDKTEKILTEKELKEKAVSMLTTCSDKMLRFIITYIY